ncbi:Uncharacterised protein [Chlamydia trachomatis]|nr:Uncharacterised protein [Chlamydia trachomatis]
MKNNALIILLAIKNGVNNKELALIFLKANLKAILLFIIVHPV